MERVQSAACSTGKVGILIPALLLAGLGSAPAAAGDAVARGEGVYQTLCVSCHGRYGRGDGPLAGALQAPLPLSLIHI